MKNHFIALRVCFLMISIFIIPDISAQKISDLPVASFKGKTPFAIRNSIISADKKWVAVAIKDDEGEISWK